MCAGRRRSDARGPLESRILGWQARPLCAVCAQSQTEQEERVETEKRLKYTCACLMCLLAKL